MGCFGPAFQACSGCRAKDGPQALRVRAWTCEACAVFLDRHIKASLNVVKSAGPKVLQRALLAIKFT
ncbi:zinc ribbon domain-containing protein [Streptomyces sp. NPDC048643]|uniref:zinc ribbon domain-containing protein n=1 Tax=Streptomyces sp. NPDC048643 TaxID=3155637 RepID=UPI00341C0631